MKIYALKRKKKTGETKHTNIIGRVLRKRKSEKEEDKGR